MKEKQFQIVDAANDRSQDHYVLQFDRREQNLRINYLYTLFLSQSCMNVKNIIFFFQALGIFTDYMTYLKKINKTICTFLKDLMY